MQSLLLVVEGQQGSYSDKRENQAIQTNMVDEFRQKTSYSDKMVDRSSLPFSNKGLMVV